MALDPEKRMKVLAAVPPNVVEGLPDLQKEQAAARQKQQEERQMEMRRMRPPLNELLEPQQLQVALRGTPEQRAALFASMDAGQTPEGCRAPCPRTRLPSQPELRRMGVMSRSPQQVVIGDLREAKLYRALDSNRQLEEVLADFWFNHFNIFEGKDRVRAMLASYERDAIRPHVLGKFKDLLLATARHPAMLFYLDNWQSMSPDVFQIGPFAPGPFVPAQQLARQAHGLNENYGRELLELHTLGVNGGFTQQDVIAVARCFTGWTIRQPNQKPEFTFAAFMHDTAEKKVLGHVIPAGGGEQDGLAGDRDPGPPPIHGTLHFHQARPPFRGGRSAADADRAHGAYLYEDRWRSARRAGSHVHVARVLLRRRAAVQGQVAAGDGGERGSRLRRTPPTRSCWRKRLPIWASRSMARKRPTDTKTAARPGLAPPA